MRPQNSIYLNFKSNCLHRLLERGIIIPFHKKICSWCHSIPHAKVFKLDKTAAILVTLKNLNDAGMVENRDLGWVEHLLYRCISDFANSARAEYFSTFCISVSLLIEDLASQLLSMIRGLDKLVPEQHVAKKLSRSTICKVCKKIYENNLKKVIGHSLSVYHLKRRRLPWKLVENKCTKS